MKNIVVDTLALASLAFCAGARDGSGPIENSDRVHGASSSYGAQRLRKHSCLGLYQTGPSIMRWKLSQ